VAVGIEHEGGAPRALHARPPPARLSAPIPPCHRHQFRHHYSGSGLSTLGLLAIMLREYRPQASVGNILATSSQIVAPMVDGLRSAADLDLPFGYHLLKSTRDILLRPLMRWVGPTLAPLAHFWVVYIIIIWYCLTDTWCPLHYAPLTTPKHLDIHLTAICIHCNHCTATKNTCSKFAHCTALQHCNIPSL
jgi:hypothetical protein